MGIKARKSKSVAPARARKERAPGPLRVYVAARFSRDGRRVAHEAMSAFIGDGHVITYDWTNHDNAALTGEELTAYKTKCAVDEMLAVANADVLVLIPSEGCKGAWVELGMSIAMGKSQIVVGDPAETGGCVFETLPSVVRVPDLATARAMLVAAAAMV